MSVLVRLAALAGLVVVCATVPAEALIVREEERPARTLSEEEQTEIADFVAGNVLFTLYHEAGHALISEFELPVLGREEDAVDALAALMMIPEEPDEQQDAWVLAAADWFAMTHDLAGEVEETSFAGEHGLDLQRFYQLVCLIYGSDPEGWEDLLETTGLPPERAERCPDELAQVATAWVKLLEPHEGKALKPIAVTYGPAGEYEDIYLDLRDSEVLEVIAGELSDTFAFENQLTITAEQCGEENAYWDPETRTITLCYELVEGARALIVEDILAR